MAVNVRLAQSSDIDRVVDSYRAWGYRHGVQPADTVWLAEDGDQLIGVVRIAPENGTLVLRGMRIAEAWRGHRIGTQMLGVLAAWLGNRECYCVPYDHLTEFYGQIGFVEIAPEVAPAFLAARLREYRRLSMQVTVMVRCQTTPAPHRVSFTG